MDGIPDTNGTATAGDNGEEFDPKEAAALLQQTRRQARRGFDPNPPLLSVLRAMVVLGAYTAIWLSVRGQHPYKGPNGWAIAGAYVLVFIVIGATLSATARATAGVGGKTRRQLTASMSILGVAWIVVYVFQGALYHAGASHAIVYGLYPATAPLMIVGLVGAASAAAREDWPVAWPALTVSLIATGSAFAGPVNAWLAMGIGLFAGLLGNAALTAWVHRGR
jgi:hypothetical protein